MSTFFNDIKYSIRQLIKSPIFTLVACRFAEFTLSLE